MFQDPCSKIHVPDLIQIQDHSGFRLKIQIFLSNNFSTRIRNPVEKHFCSKPVGFFHSKSTNQSSDIIITSMNWSHLDVGKRLEEVESTLKRPLSAQLQTILLTNHVQGKVQKTCKNKKVWKYLLRLGKQQKKISSRTTKRGRCKGQTTKGSRKKLSFFSGPGIQRGGGEGLGH